ncbi:MAG: metallophosphoesterase [Desulfomonilaceae bacterium]
MKTLLLGAVASFLVLCQWFAFRSVLKYLWPNSGKISRSVSYSVLIVFGLLTILAVRLEFGSEFLPPGTIGRQLASTILRSYLGWILVLSSFFLFVRLIEWLPPFRKILVRFALIKATVSAYNESEIEKKANLAENKSKSVSNPNSGGIERTNNSFTTRRGFLKIAATSSLAIATGVGIKGMADAYSSPVVEKYELVHDLLSVAKPITFIHVTDCHFGMFFGPHELRNLVNHLNSLEGDSLCITGDVFHSSRTLVEQATPILGKLKARALGNFAVLGNHDFYAGEGRSVKSLQAAGLTLLRNQWIPLKVENSTIHLGGIDDPLINWMRTQEVWGFDPFMEKVPSAPGMRILLSHRPDVFRYAIAQKIDVVLAGHTHGGQVIIPVPRRKKGISIADVVSKYSHGWYKKHSSRMYVNRGVGLTFLPWRLHCPPEIAVIKLSAPGARPTDV